MERRMLSKFYKAFFVAGIFVLALLCLIFSGCDNINAKNTKIFVENYESEAIVAHVGEFDYDKFNVVARFEDGSTQKTKLKKEMLSELDQMYLLRVGEYDLTLNAFNTTGTIKVKIVRKDFSAVQFQSKTVVYDGNVHSVAVDGNIPAGTTVSYVPSNSFSDVGTYNVTAVLTNPNFATTSFKATLTIQKAQYDMSDVSFSSKTVDYDGMIKNLTISGNLPAGVDVSYTINGRKGNSATNAGVYEIVASFSGTNSNYMEIESKTATLTIRKARYNISGLNMEDVRSTYDGLSKSVVLQGSVPNALKLSYQIKRTKDADNNDVSEDFHDGNSATNAGTYLVMATLSSNDSNYEEISPFSAELKIDKAGFSLENIGLKVAYFDYDGNVHSLAIFGEPTLEESQKYSNITVSYTIDGEEGNSATNAGRHLVVATISQDNPNYENSFTVSDYLVIAKVQYNLNLSLTNKTATYTGENISLDFDGEMPEDFSFYYQIQQIKNGDGDDIEGAILDGNFATNVGTYIVSLYVVSENPNYEDPEPLSALLTIQGVD